MENFAAAALKGVPSWNLTPLRSLKVYWSPSGEMVQDSASPGTIWVVSSANVTSGSTMRRPTRLELKSVTCAGSRFTGSATSPTTSVPAGCAVADPPPRASASGRSRARLRSRPIFIARPPDSGEEIEAVRRQSTREARARAADPRSPARHCRPPRSRRDGRRASSRGCARGCAVPSSRPGRSRSRPCRWPSPAPAAPDRRRAGRWPSRWRGPKTKMPTSGSSPSALRIFVTSRSARSTVARSRRGTKRNRVPVEPV